MELFLQGRSLIRLPVAALVLWWVAVPAGTAESVPLAVKGYDVVAYFTLHKPTAGRSEFEYVWDERRYRFATAGHLAKFKANPAGYVPRFGNLCANALAGGEVFEANPEYWLVNDGRLYLFGRAEGPRDFLNDPRGIVAAAERNAALLRDGKPLVSGKPR